MQGSKIYDQRFLSNFLLLLPGSVSVGNLPKFLPFVLKEIEWALQYFKNVIIVYHTDMRNGSKIDFAYYRDKINSTFSDPGTPCLAFLCCIQPPYNMCAADQQWLLKNAAVPYDQRSGYDAVMIENILKQMSCSPLPGRMRGGV